MNTLELKGHLLKIIANTEDKSVLEKLNAYMSSLMGKDVNKNTTPEWHIPIVEKRLKNLKKNPDQLLDLDQALDDIDSGL